MPERHRTPQGAGGPLSPLLIPIPEEIEGPRVSLRCLAPEDAPALWEAVEGSRERLEPWLRWPREVRSADGARQKIQRDRANWLLRERLEWGVFGRGDGRLLGSIAFSRNDWEGRVFETGYWLRKTAEGRGYMREALALLTRLAFETLGANRVVVRVEAGNARSRKVPEALGYVLEGTLRRDHLGLDGRPTDMRVYALIPDDYLSLEWAATPARTAPAGPGQ
jgi:RimJ/RimL family protein N-acetyltransferase